MARNIHSFLAVSKYFVDFYALISFHFKLFLKQKIRQRQFTMDSGYCETDRYVISLSLMGKYFAKIFLKIIGDAWSKKLFIRIKENFSN